MKNFTLFCTLLLALASGLAACSGAAPTASATASAAMPPVSAAVTLTSPPPAVTATPTASKTTAPTATKTPRMPTSTPRATPTPCVDKAKFISETVPDDTVFTGGDVFDKTWTLENTGTCTWDERYQVRLVPDAAGLYLPLGGSSRKLPNVVAPGEQVTIKLQLAVPLNAGTYRAELYLVNANGIDFGVGASGSHSFYVQIVAQAKPTAAAVVNTPVPGCYKGTYVSETVPDNSKMFAGEIFGKQWTVQNSGTCDWVNIRLPWYKDGGFGMPPGAPRSGNPQGEVAVGDQITLGWPLIAPLEPGTYRADFLLAVGDGTQFGVGKKADTPLYVQVQVVDLPVPEDALSLSGIYGEPTFHDTFEAGNAAWAMEPVAADLGKMTVADGKLSMQAVKGVTYWSMRGAMPKPRGQALEAVFTTDASCPDTNAYGVMTSLNESRGQMADGYLFRFNCKGEFSIGYVDTTRYQGGNGPYVLLPYTANQAILAGGGQTNRLAVVAAGGKISLFANGARIAWINGSKVTTYNGAEIATLDLDFSQFEYYLLPYNDAGYPGLFIEAQESDFSMVVDEFNFWNLDGYVK